jgi:hypothetical protein
MKFITVILAAALIFLTDRILKLGLKYILNRYPRLDFLGNVLIITEFLVCLIFVFLSTDFLFSEKFYYRYLLGGLVFIVLGLLTWFLVSDILAGCIFRLKYNLKTGTHITAGNLSGQVKSQHLTSIRSITNDGLIQNIPYTWIINKVITEKGFRGTPDEHMLQIQADLSLGRTKAEELIRTALLTTPWSNLKDEPKIRFIEGNDKGYIYEITLFSIKMKHMQLIEIALNKVPSLYVVSQK